MIAEEQAKAARVRFTEEHPEDDPKLEAELLPRLLDLELSPLFLDSFDDVPNTYVVTVEFDLLRDVGLLFVRRLRTLDECEWRLSTTRAMSTVL